MRAAVGVDDRGTKQVLGLREGATENAAAVWALLAELVERGLDTLPGRAQEDAMWTEAAARAWLRHGLSTDESQAYATFATRGARRQLDFFRNACASTGAFISIPAQPPSLREVNFSRKRFAVIGDLGYPENLERVLSSTNLLSRIFSAGCVSFDRAAGFGRICIWQSPATMVLRAGPQLGCWGSRERPGSSL